MVSATYLSSALVSAALAFALMGGDLTTWSFMAFILVIFFLASAGASSAYLTVSEIFPMETRALSIAFFYAVGTGAGGIAGPLLFGHLIESGSQDQVAIGFFIGAAVMALGGIAEILFGVAAEQETLEDIAEPLSAEEEGAEAEPEKPEGPPRRKPVRARRYRLGPGRLGTSPGMPVSAPFATAGLEREVDAIVQALEEHGSATRRELASRVGARFWGPGLFRAALGQAVLERRIRRVRRGTYAPVE
jgi:MFS family permease